MKELNEMVWPVEGYTDKISSGIRFTLQRSPHLTFTKRQICESLERGYPWLKNRNAQQEQLLTKLINLYTKRLIQTGQVKKVKSNVSIEPQWMWANAVAESGYINTTSEDSVAHSEAAKKSVSRKPVNPMTLHRMNNVILEVK